MEKSKLGRLDWTSGPHGRKTYVLEMFEVISNSYDRFTARFSFGMDRHWKRVLLSWAKPWSRAADIACGTGDLLVGLAEQNSSKQLIGVDLSTRMASHACRKLPQGGAVLVADMTNLPIRTAAVDLITSGYGFRNVPDLDQAIKEVYRTLSPSGQLLVLDFYRPRNRVWSAFFRKYLSIAGRLVGLIVHSDAATYGYIAESIAHYITAGEFERKVEDAGFACNRRRVFLGGGICLHSFVRN